MVCLKVDDSRQGGLILFQRSLRPVDVGVVDGQDQLPLANAQRPGGLDSNPALASLGAYRG